MYRFPWLEKPLAKLCRYRIPVLFGALFALHFTYYYLISEGCSVYQFLVHARDFGINPVLRKTTALNTSGRPFDPGYGDWRDDEPGPATEDHGSPEPTPVTVELGRRPA
ncbi:MAG: hypothetical protein U0P45_02100 [Acidimicrobiales bacterium]